MTWLTQKLSRSVTKQELSTQWHQPGDILSLLLIIGGDVVQNALAQLTGPRFAPVCFSFGWVAYAFTSIVALSGHGRLMPAADYPCKVFSLDSGYIRENHSFILGRLLRDLEVPLTDEALSVRIFDASSSRARPGLATSFVRRKIVWMSSLVLVIQHGIALIPFLVNGDWGALLVTGTGSVLALATASLPQWRAEKFGCRKDSKKMVAITRGNGARHIVIIRGNGNCLDLEDLAAGEGPRDSRPWLGIGFFSRFQTPEGKIVKYDRRTVMDAYAKSLGYVKAPRKHLWTSHFTYMNGTDLITLSESKARAHYVEVNHVKEDLLMFQGLPVDLWVTRLVYAVFAFAWVAILISVSGLKANSWYLIAIGVIGMLQNALVSSVGQPPERHGIFLNPDPIHFTGKKAMDVLMEVEESIPGAGRVLRAEFSGTAPNKYTDAEDAWWQGDKDFYNRQRFQPKFKGLRYDDDARPPVYGQPSRGRLRKYSS